MGNNYDERFLRDIKPFLEDIKNKKISIGYSGGPDSLALTLMMYNLSKVYNLELFPIIIDHRLRKESGDEALFVAKKLYELTSLKSDILKVDEDIPQFNLMENARKARYKKLFEFCNAKDINFLFLGHHKNDNASTIMMNILRGTGLDGLKGILKKTTNNKMIIIRPLLDWTKNEIANYLQTFDFKGVHDSTNKNLRFNRTKTLQILFNIQKEYFGNDQNEIIYDKFTLLSNNVKRSIDCIEFYLKNELVKCCELKDCGIILDIRYFLLLHEEIRFRILRKIIFFISQCEHMPELNSVIYLDNWISHIYKKKTELIHEKCLINDNKKIKLTSQLYGVEFFYNQANLYCYKENNFIEQMNILCEKNSEYVWDKRFRISIKHNIPIEDSSYQILKKISIGKQTKFNQENYKGNEVYVQNKCQNIKEDNVYKKIKKKNMPLLQIESKILVPLKIGNNIVYLADNKEVHINVSYYKNFFD